MVILVVIGQTTRQMQKCRTVWEKNFLQSFMEQTDDES